MMTRIQSARVIEVFSSIQGEGIYVGRPHLFVRFWNCNLACRYCDTDYKGPFEELTAAALTQRVRAELAGNGFFHAISLTGGEPLLAWKFLKGWLPTLRALPPKIYLETNGTLPAALAEVLPWIDIVAMDLKPPSATGDRPVWAEQEAFLRTALEAGKELFIKMVVTAETRDQEIDRAAALVSRFSAALPVVLQPVTPWGPVREGPSPAQLKGWRHRLSQRLQDVRVIPQVHPLLGVR